MHKRPGTSLIELLLFFAILSMIVGVALPLLFSATENRLLQQTISAVEQNGNQVLQNVGLRVREAERIVSPAPGATGNYLVLQMSSGSLSPTIIGLLSGSLVIIERSTQETISNEQVAISDFTVRNTSTSTTHPSLQINFQVSRTIRLQQPHSYSRDFQATMGLFPADKTIGNVCGCAAPVCASQRITWYLCEENSLVCNTATTQFNC